MPRKTELTKPADRRRSNVRQTRSQTAAAVVAAQANLQLSEEADDAAINDCQPPMIDGDIFDCSGCDRPNNAERYMVVCGKCECHYHLSCAKLDLATADKEPFTCTTCLPPKRTPARSLSSRTSTSSVRAARIARDLARLEEERKLQEEMEKLRMEELQRKQAYLAKKHDLLSQQDEIEDKNSVYSYRTNRTSSDRVSDWVDGQKRTSAIGLNVEDKTKKSTNPVTLTETNPVEQLDFNSTALPEGKTAVQVLGDTLDSATNTAIKPTEHDGATGGEAMRAIIPLVDIEPIVSTLDQFEPLYTRLGVLPKTVRVLPPNYEQWRLQPQQTTIDALKAQHKKDIELLKQRELELIEWVQSLTQLQKEQQDLQREREAKLKADLQRKEKEQADYLKENYKAAADRISEIEHLKEEQRMLADQLEAERAAKQATTGANETLQANLQNSESWFKSELAKLQQFRYDNDEGHSSMNTLTTPQGARSILSYASSFSSMAHGSDRTTLSTPLDAATTTQPLTSPIAANVNPGLVRPRSMLTSDQVAARHVVSKELPTFSGDSSEWPLFISTYMHSTEACGYTDSENLLRLQRALKGEARATVSSLLLHPSTVPQVLYSLRLRYGRPEQIVHSLIQRVKDSPAPTNFDTLTTFGLMVQNFCGHLKAMDMEKHLANPELLKQLVKKLPSHVMYNWALFQQTLPEVNLVVFGEYMAKMAAATSSVAFPEDKPSKTVKTDRQKPKEKAFVNAHAADESAEENFVGEKSTKLEDKSCKKTTVSKSCTLCNAAGHQLGDCFKFKKLSLDERWQTVKKHKLCRRCLIFHGRYNCKGEICNVSGCQGRHHRLLHNDHPREGKASETTTTDSTSSTNATVTIHRQPAATTLFRVLPVTLYGAKGQVDTFAFLDDGSSVTLVERKLAAALGLEGRNETLCIHWTGGVKKSFSDSQLVRMEISGAKSTKRFKVSNAYTVDQLGLPQQTMDYESLAAQYRHLQKLPVQSLKSAVPGILIGLSNVHLMATLKLRQGNENEPIATKTRIGWAVSGSSPSGGEAMHHRQLHICDQQDDVDLHEYVRGFFALENLGVASPSVEGVEEQRANKILAKTTKRTTSGRFETGLLWRSDYIELPDSRPMAEKRWRCLEKRLLKNSELYDNVRKQIADFLLKGYAHEATEEELASFDVRRTWYLPLGVVINPKKPGKVRVIWDAAAKVDGISLNSALLKGPDLLTSLLSVLFKFRERLIAICADIEAMFHQILIRLLDRCAQLFLWRDAPDKPLKTLVTDVAIFGATCSPTHSQYVKNLNASEHAAEFPRATAAI